MKAAHQERLVEALLLDQDEGDVISSFTREGYSKAEVSYEIATARESPTYRAAVRVQKGQAKLRSLVDALGTQWSRSPLATKVPVIDFADSDAFYEHYLFANRPVVIRGLLDDWPALWKWSPEYFKEVYGDRSVEIMSGRDEDSDYELNLDAHRRNVPLRDYCAYVLSGEGNDQYLVARNNLLKRPEFADLLNDIVCPREYLKPEHIPNGNVWMGPRGTQTPLHHDHCNVLFAQIYGSKRFHLVEPHALPRVYNERAHFSAVDINDIDLLQFPKMASVAIAEVIVNPGDTLLIPMGWFHAVQSLAASISISFTKTAVPALPVRWIWA